MLFADYMQIGHHSAEETLAFRFWYPGSSQNQFSTDTKGCLNVDFNNLIHTIFVTLVLYKSTHFNFLSYLRGVGAAMFPFIRLSKMRSVQVKSQS